VLKEAVSLQVPNVRRLADQVELRRAMFHEARVVLKERKLAQKTDFRTMSPSEKLPLTGEVMMRGTHVVIIENEVVELWKDAVGHAMKQDPTVAQKSEDNSRDADSMVPRDATMLKDEDEVDTLLTQFETMSGCIPSLKDSADFQHSAKQLIDMVHSSISTLLNLHDSASAGMSDCVVLRGQFSDGVKRSQDLWNKVKDDIARIQKLRGACEDAPVKLEQVDQAVSPKPFMKIVEHSLQSLGVIREICAKEDAQKDVFGAAHDDKDDFNSALFSALGGGSYQRLVDWGESFEKLTCKRAGRKDEEELNTDLSDNFLNFLDECHDASLETLDKSTSPSPRPNPRHTQLTQDHVITQRRFTRNANQAIATPSEPADVDQKLHLVALHSPPGCYDGDLRLDAGMVTPSDLGTELLESCSGSRQSSSCASGMATPSDMTTEPPESCPGSSQSARHDVGTAETTEAAWIAHLDEGSAGALPTLLPKPPSTRSLQGQFRSPNRKMTRPAAASASQRDDGSSLVLAPPVDKHQRQANEESLGNSSALEDSGSSRCIAALSDPAAATSRSRGLALHDSLMFDSSDDVSQNACLREGVREPDALHPRWISQNGRRFIVKGESLRGQEDPDASFPLRRKSCALTSLDSIPVAEHPIDSEKEPRQHALMVRGRSFKELPPLSDVPNRLLNSTASSPAESDDECAGGRSPSVTHLKIPIMGFERQTSRLSCRDAEPPSRESSRLSFSSGSSCASSQRTSSSKKRVVLKKKLTLPELVDRQRCRD
jgi:hypothetical protein